LTFVVAILAINTSPKDVGEKILPLISKTSSGNS
jgi:hypothetical protein